jgi:hypothetical protein
MKMVDFNSAEMIKGKTKNDSSKEHYNIPGKSNDTSNAKRVLTRKQVLVQQSKQQVVDGADIVKGVGQGIYFL